MAFAEAAKRLKLSILNCTYQKPYHDYRKGSTEVACPPVNTPNGCHRNSLENSNICVFGNIQTLTRVFLPETDMRLSQRNLGAPPVAHEIRNQGNDR